MASATEIRQRLLDEAAVLEEQLGYARYSSIAAAEAIETCRRNGWRYDRIDLQPNGRWLLVYEVNGRRRLYQLPIATEELQADLQAGQLNDEALEMVETCSIPAPTGLPRPGGWPRLRAAWLVLKYGIRQAWQEGRR